MRRQTGFTNEAFDFLNGQLSFFLIETKDHRVVDVAKDLVAKIGV
ncbi:hypothetical protein FHS27_006241 [Rhodopirellula rubra]|uniref:Uncharacterized protein n=1 Tax=Aporhodopirellula rubra TaxID=980271 RepID=A0A7W5E625_9BACT|nr:hypothetical protein [Aporhodopirellula rubra]MBB3210394.1 hypothetical protein [Aporhodopirellula rubra]